MGYLPKSAMSGNAGIGIPDALRLLLNLRWMTSFVVPAIAFEPGGNINMSGSEIPVPQRV